MRLPVGISKYRKGFRVWIYRDGHRHTRTRDSIGQPLTTLRDASACRNALQKELGRPANLSTVAQILDTWVEHAKRSKKSWKDDEQRAAVLKRMIGGEIAANFRRESVEKLLEDLQQGRKPATVNQYLALLKSAYNYAIDNEVLEKNPCRKVRKLATNNLRLRTVTDDELLCILPKCRPHLARAIIWLRFTGLRVGELLAATIADVDTKRCLLQPRAQQSANKRQNAVPLPDLLLEDARQIGKGPIIGYGIGKRRRPLKFIRTAWVAAVSGMEPQNTGQERTGRAWLHDLRRSYISHLRALGVHPDVMDMIVGHRKAPNIRDHYNVILQQELDLVRQRLNACPLIAQLAPFLKHWNPRKGKYLPMVMQSDQPKEL